MAVRNVAAIILAGGQGERLSVLSAQRAKPAVPFAGKYRIIDFTLSNCVNSGIYNVAVLTQYRPHSLNDHIGVGKPWDLDRARGGATVAVMPVPMEEAHRFGTLVTDLDNQVMRWEEKPPVPTSNLISMGIYVFEYELLLRRLEEDVADPSSSRDFGRDVVPRMVELDRVYAYPFKAYWKDVGTIDSYFESNMGLLNDPPDFDLYDKDWIIHTRSEERPPARVAEEG